MGLGTAVLHQEPFAAGESRGAAKMVVQVAAKLALFAEYVEAAPGRT